MRGEFARVEEAQELDELFARTNDAPVVIFKHSATCPISSHAYREMTRLAPDLKERVRLIVVQTARDLSNDVARRTGVRHESPQAIIIRGGEAVWSASHYDITAQDVTEALKNLITVSLTIEK